ncbi:class I SAM-dependent methyltransferase [Elusimicrobiota bacterium]
MQKDKPSRTARKVAINVITLGSVPEMKSILPRGIVEATAKLLVASGVVSAKVIGIARSKTAVRIYEVFDWMMPGQFLAFGHRKAFFERMVREAIAAGATQVLSLGAGYDTLGWRLAPEFPNVSFFEINHPATARLKAKGIQSMGERDNLHLISEDLAKRKLVDVLKAEQSWSTKAQTIILAEGLLMYLPPIAVKDLFKQCAEITGSGSRIAFTYIDTGADGRPDAGPWTKLTMWILKVSGEPWLWSVRPQELDRFLEETDWKNAPDLLGTNNKLGIEFLGIAKK